MPTPSFANLRDNPTLNDVVDHVYRLQKDLNYLLISLDDVNVSRLNAKVIVANTITGDKISANTITANKMNVSELSAISANIGDITAGTITGITITGGTLRTAITGSRIELSSNSLRTYNSAGNLNGIVTGLGYGAQYGDLSFYDAGTETFRIENSGASGGWNLRPMNGGSLVVGYGGSTVLPNGTWDFTNATVNNTTSVGTHNHGIPNGTVLMVDGGGTVTWVASGAHGGHLA